MNASRFAVAFAVLAVAGAASAQSFIPGNHIDNFGPVASDSGDAPETVVTRAYASPIAANYVDVFGTDATSRTSSARAMALPASPSPIPSNYVADFGTEPTSAAPDSLLADSRHMAR
jgi:hypothetical protein